MPDHLGPAPLPPADRIWAIHLSGTVPSKKNEKIPTVNKKTGRVVGMHYEAQPEIDALAKQIEPQFRDLGLLHPDIDLFFSVRTGGSDRDGKEATILDLLVKYGVIQNDNISSCNGMVVTHPARRADVEGVLIILKDTGIDRWPDKPKEKRKKKS